MESRALPPGWPRHFAAQIDQYLSGQSRRANSEARFRTILAAVLQEWADVGFLRANISAIAERARVSTATLYRLFPSRETLNLEALAFGHVILMQAMETRPRHPNLLRNLVHMVNHYTEILCERHFRQFSLGQTFMVRQDADQREEASRIAFSGHRALHGLWIDEVRRLIDEGFLRDGDVDHMMFRLIGPIEARALHWYQAGRGYYQPSKSWLHEGVDVVEGFFAVYGTRKYKIFRDTYSWDWNNLAAVSASFRDPPVRIAGGIQRWDSLPHIGQLEQALAQKAVPQDFIVFVFRELKAMSSRTNNRLDPTNRRNRILAAAIHENFERGFENLSIAGIARRAGVSTATLYRVFGDDRSLYDEAHMLGLSFFCAWVAQDSPQVNPIARMADYLIRPLLTYMDPRSLRLGSIQFGLIARTEEGEVLPTSPLLIRYIYGFWDRRFARLRAENFLSEPTSWKMIMDVFGPVQSMSWGLKSNSGQTWLPSTSWYEVCWRVAEDFFQLYGTPHFHACLQKHGWNKELPGFNS
ncbi:HTH-type transcriptional regulator BetI [Candidatus Phycosocius bacilliformis]|uniref:HTH-type transcriptional regulator BetI n=1 Tax=Candidatus Phycosocius bacilliformis TaxID=1445552 RepID=A0A2P2EBH9_9PROT|nr:TetR/AcrR family transcriptional regulator [Candidatus Phycosocius bacilliformis]GBF58420.1 HTH-type transcriptional regulator BetI [Candidatus Phycosocius bacilliformis]